MTAWSSLSIREAADILEIANHATMNEIRSQYHTLVKEWHPDVSQRNPEDTHTRMIRINDAYGVLIDYCMNYEFSFRPEDLKVAATGNPVDSWMERYGDDPIWGPRPRSPPQSK
jgi:preprotein translocase subunit Sec63